MTDTPQNDVNKAMAEMREKSRQLNDSLQELVSQGFDGLAQAARNAARTPARRPAGEIATEELSKLLRQELAAGISAVFAGNHGNAGISVVVHNNTPAQVGIAESTDAFDRKTLEITIDQMVANSLARGRETGGVLRALFGIVPSLLGR